MLGKCTDLFCFKREFVLNEFWLNDRFQLLKARQIMHFMKHDQTNYANQHEYKHDK